MARKIIWVSPQTILKKWLSSDSRLEAQTLRDVLRRKRDSEKYQDALEFLEREGFHCPLSFRTLIQYNGNGNFDNVRCHHEGHHRLCAAITLGYKRVPYIEVEEWWESYDGRTDPPRQTRGVSTVLLHPLNPVPKKFKKKNSQ